MAALSDSLSVIMGGDATKLIIEMGKASTATKNYVSAEQQQAIADQKLITLAAQKVAAQEKVNLAPAKQAGGGGAGSAEHLASAEAAKAAAAEQAKLALVQKDVALSAAQAEASAGKLSTGMDGLICRVREFFNPTAAARALRVASSNTVVAQPQGV